MSVISNAERALRLAAEHCEWAQAEGQAPRHVILSLRPQRVSARQAALLTWDDAIEAVARAWMRLP